MRSRTGTHSLNLVIARSETTTRSRIGGWAKAIAPCPPYTSNIDGGHASLCPPYSCCANPMGAPRNDARLFHLAVFVELRNVSPEVVGFRVVLDAGKHHLGAGDFRPRVLDVFLEGGGVPGDAGVLVGIGVIVVRRGTRLAAVEPVELRADLVLGVLANRMAGHAFVEGCFAR